MSFCFVLRVMLTHFLFVTPPLFLVTPWLEPPPTELVWRWFGVCLHPLWGANSVKSGLKHWRFHIWARRCTPFCTCTDRFMSSTPLQLSNLCVAHTYLYTHPRPPFISFSPIIYYSWLLFISFPSVPLPPCCVATSPYHRLIHLSSLLPLSVLPMPPFLSLYFLFSTLIHSPSLPLPSSLLSFNWLPGGSGNFVFWLNSGRTCSYFMITL